MSEQVEWQRLADYRGSDGVVLWWKFAPATHERPYVGTPNDMLFVRTYTHWTALPLPPAKEPRP